MEAQLRTFTPKVKAGVAAVYLRVDSAAKVSVELSTFAKRTVSSMIEEIVASALSAIKGVRPNVGLPTAIADASEAEFAKVQQELAQSIRFETLVVAAGQCLSFSTRLNPIN